MDPSTLRAGGVGLDPLFRLGEAAAAAGGRLLCGDPGAPLRGVAADTRAVSPGDLFCAVRGERVDGHTLAAAALSLGAAALLVDRPPGAAWQLSDVPAGGGAILVPAVLPALGRLARRHLAGLRRGSASPRVAAVTGSVGKTGTRRLMAAALAAGGAPVLAAQDSFNTELTVPIICLRAGSEHRFAALELAMRGPGEITQLCQICEPEVGVITLIGDSHAERLGSRAAVAAAKAELIAALPPGGAAVLNADDPWQAPMRGRTRARVITYGLSAPADVVGEGVRSDASGSTFMVRAAAGPGRAAVRAPVRLRQIGRHQVANALAALACAIALEIPLEAAAAALQEVTAADGRLQVRELGCIRLLDDAYNAAPQSLLAALAALELMAPAGRRAAVLGDMLELGPLSAEGHAQGGRAAAASGLRWLVTVGPLAEGIAAAAVASGQPAATVHAAPDLDGALPILERLLEPGIALLVKGSRAVGLEAAVQAVERWSATRGAGGRQAFLERSARGLPAPSP